MKSQSPKGSLDQHGNDDDIGWLDSSVLETAGTKDIQDSMKVSHGNFGYGDIYQNLASFSCPIVVGLCCKCPYYLTRGRPRVVRSLFVGGT